MGSVHIAQMRRAVGHRYLSFLLDAWSAESAISDGEVYGNGPSKRNTIKIKTNKNILIKPSHFVVSGLGRGRG